MTGTVCSLRKQDAFHELRKEGRVGTRLQALQNKMEKYGLGHNKTRQAHVELHFKITFVIQQGEQNDMHMKLSF